MSYRVTANETAAQLIETRQDKLHLYPSRGLQVGGGYHAPTLATWNGSGPVPHGWSSYRGSRQQHPSQNQWAVPIDPETSAALGNGRAARLTAQEQAELAADVAAAVETLPSDWFPDGGAGALAEGQGKR